MTGPTDRDRTAGDPTDGASTPAPAEPRRPSPGAQAASRARRIGGRPLPTPRQAAPARDASSPEQGAPVKGDPPPTGADEPYAETAPTPAPAPRPAPPGDTASMGARLLARLVDGVLVGLTVATLSAIASVVLVAAHVGGTGPLVAVFLAEIPVITVLGFGYEAIMIGRTGATFGKRLVGISVVDVRTGAPIGIGRALLRAIVLGVTGSVLLGYLSPFFNPDRRGWHDFTGRDRVRRGAAAGAEGAALPASARSRWIPVVVVGVVAYLIIGATNSYALSALAKKPVSSHAGQALRQQVLAAAKTCTARILSYDYRTLPTDEKAGQACSTGQLTSDYTKLMDSTVKQIAPQNNVVQVFQVEKAGVQKVSPDGKQWVILIYGQQQVTSKTVTSGPRLDISNAVVTMNKVNGQWLISALASPS